MRKLLLLNAVLLLCATASIQAAITGTVMTEEGAPVAGATITAFMREPAGVSLARWMSGEPAREALATAKSDSKGKFTLSPETTGVVDLSIHAPGFVPDERQATATMDLGALPLRAGKPFRGVVIGGGKSVAGATVVVGEGQVLTTDEEGAFHLTLKGEDAPIVRVYHRDFAPFELLGGTVSRLEKVELSPGVTVRGLVVDSKDEPVAGAELSIDGIPYGKSGEDGTFALQGVSPSWRQITAVDGMRIASGSRIASRREYPLRLLPGATISGNVKSSRSGGGEAGVIVEVDVSDRMRPGLPAGQAITDAKGTYTIGPIAPGRYRMRTLSPAFAVAHSEISLGAGERAKRDMAIEPFSVISGNVSDQDRRPIAAARISSADEAWSPIAIRFLTPTWSGPDGAFVFRGSTDGEITLAAKRRGLPTGKSDPVTVKPGTTRTGVRITIPRGIEVAGIVTNLSGDPLRDASIRFTPGAGPQNRMVMQRYMGVRAIDPELIYTDAAGRFTASLESGKYDLLVQREGYASAVIGSIQVQRGIEPLEVRLTEGATITGRVVRPDGSGVPDVQIGAITNTRLQSNEAVTGPDGGFTLADLMPGAVTLWATNVAQNIREIRNTEAPTTDLVIGIPAGGTIRGRVVDKGTGRPITSFEVGPSGERRGAGMVMMGPANLTRFQSDDGSFELENIPEGSLELLAQAPGYVSARMPGVEVKPGGVTDEVEIKLEPGTRITGRVLGPDGSPVSRARISKVAESSAEAFPVARSNETVASDGDGNYVMEGLPEGEVELRAIHQNFVTETKKVKVAGREMQVDFRLGRGSEVQGVVVTDSGVPVADADVFARSAAANSGGQSAKTDGNGTFRMSGLADGRYSFRASKVGMVTGTVEDVAVGTGIPVRIELGAGGTVAGRVLGLQASESSVVQVVASNGPNRAQSGVSPDGSFTIEGVAPGSTRIWAEGTALMARRTSAEKVVEVSSGSRVAVDLEFGPGQSVRGRVTRRGAPVDGASISFTPKDRSLPSGSSRSDRAGSFEVGGLQEGDYLVRAFDPRTMGSWSGEHRVGGSGALDIDMRGSRIAGRVIHSTTGEAIADANVTLEPSNPDQRGLSMPGRSDAAGNFVIDNIHPGDYRVRVARSGFGQEVRELRVSDSAVSDLEFRLSPTDGIALRIVDARDGRALNSFISVLDGAGRVAQQGPFRPDSSGITRISLAPGSYSALVNASGYASQRIQFSVPGAQLAVALRPGGSIRIDSSATSSVRARLLDPTGHPRQSAIWDPRPEMTLRPGSTMIENVGPGIYTLEILDAAGAVTDRKQVNVVEGQLSVVGI
jgi:large repetitive protein